MAKIVIDNSFFPFDLGCKVLKAKCKECPDIEEVKDFWDDIVPLTTLEVFSIENIEQRRIALLYLNINDIIKDANPKLLNSSSIPKTTRWMVSSGEFIDVSYDDRYELYEIDGELLNKGVVSSFRKIPDCHFVKFKDTSTDREYMLWVDLESVAKTNSKKIENVTAIDAIAWSIMTNIPKGDIKQIIRQGDCILIEPTSDYSTVPERHLTNIEYLSLIKLES